MTYQNQNTRNEGEANKPTHIVKVRDGSGRRATYERIGVAWENVEDGSLYIRVHGTQIVSGGFTCYPIDDQEAGQ